MSETRMEKYRRLRDEILARGEKASEDALWAAPTDEERLLADEGPRLVLECFEERAAILEYDAGLPRPEAERRARDFHLPRCGDEDECG